MSGNLPKWFFENGTLEYSIQYLSVKKKKKKLNRMNGIMQISMHVCMIELINLNKFEFLNIVVKNMYIIYYGIN